MNDKLKNFLKSQITVADYENFHTKIGMSKTRFTQLQNDPLSIDMREMLDLCDAIGMEPESFVITFISPLKKAYAKERKNVAV